MAFPEVVSREQWLAARVALLAEEKQETRRRDALNAERRKLPMVRIEKDYVFAGPQGPVTLAALFGPSRQLLDGQRSTEMPGHSCFLRTSDEIFHTYSTFGRGNEYTPSLYTLLDLTALGRQEAWEEPKGRAPVLQDT